MVITLYGALVYIICLYVACYIKGAEREHDFRNCMDRKQIECYTASQVKKKEQSMEKNRLQDVGLLDTPGG